MSKHVHPIDFRFGKPVHSKEVDFSNTFKRKSIYSVASSLKSLPNFIAQSSDMENMLIEALRKYGYYVSYLQITTHPENIEISGTLFINHSNQKEIPKFNKKHLNFLTQNIKNTYKLHFNKNTVIKWTLQVYSTNQTNLNHIKNRMQTALKGGKNLSFYQAGTGILALITIRPVAGILCQFLSQELPNVANHLLLLDFIGQGIEKIIKDSNSPLNACLIKVKGRINGSERATSYQFRRGAMPLQTLNIPLNYADQITTTKYGKLSIKVYLMYQ